MSHAEGKKHLKNMNSTQGQAFFLVKKTQPVPVDNNDQSTNDQPTASTSQQGEGNAAVCALTLTKMKGKQWMPVTLADKVTKAEILMASKLVTSNYSFSSYAEMGEICKLAFSDSEICSASHDWKD